MKEEYLTLKEVAKELRLTTKTVAKFLDSGELEASKLGAQWRITRTQLSEFVRSKIAISKDQEDYLEWLKLGGER